MQYIYDHTSMSRFWDNTFMIADCGVGKYVTFTQKISMAKLSEKYSGQV